MSDSKLVLLIALGVFIGQIAFAYRRLLGKVVLFVVVWAVYLGVAYALGYGALRYGFGQADVWPGWVFLLGLVLTFVLTGVVAEAFDWLRYRARPEDRTALRHIWRFAARTLGAPNKRN